jgi:nucleoside-diphosphate-sugar epimerase
VARLCDQGVRVRALVLPAEDASALGGGVDVERGDITDPASLARAVAGQTRVYHLAAIVGDWGDEALFQRVNVDGTRNVLDAAAAAGCARVVAVSSVVMYGAALQGDVCDEVATPREYGVGPYSRSKRAAEEVALDYHAFGRVPVTVVRPGNVYGPASAVWVDEVARALRANRGVLIDGGDGDASLAYVDNVVDVLVRAGSADAAPGRIYNANDGSGVTWRRYLTDLAAIIGAPAPTRSIPGGVAMAMAAAMEKIARWRGRAERPLLTREAVLLLRSRAEVSIRRARDDLDYHPLVPYEEAMKRIASYLEG